MKARDEVAASVLDERLHRLPRVVVRAVAVPAHEVLAPLVVLEAHADDAVDLEVRRVRGHRVEEARQTLREHGAPKLGQLLAQFAGEFLIERVLLDMPRRLADGDAQGRLGFVLENAIEEGEQLSHFFLSGLVRKEFDDGTILVHHQVVLVQLKRRWQHVGDVLGVGEIS